MQPDIEQDLTLIRPLSGLFLGQLTEPELEAFCRLESAGLAFRAYAAASGFLGLAKVGFPSTAFIGRQ